MDWRQKTIEKFFGGDEQRFEKAFQATVEEGMDDVIYWKDLSLSATVLPELEEQTKDLIEQRLGYIPHLTVTLPFEPYLRSLLQNYRQGTFSSDDFCYQAEEHIKLIRNKDMKPNLCLTYNPLIYKNYDETFFPYGQKAKERIIQFLGYEPKLEHSLIAEMWLRDIIAKDNLPLPNHQTAIDLKVITLIKYREILLEHGQAVADASPLWGLNPII